MTSKYKTTTKKSINRKSINQDFLGKLGYLDPPQTTPPLTKKVGKDFPGEGKVELRSTERVRQSNLGQELSSMSKTLKEEEARNLQRLKTSVVEA